MVTCEKPLRNVLEWFLHPGWRGASRVSLAGAMLIAAAAGIGSLSWRWAITGFCLSLLFWVPIAYVVITTRRTLVQISRISSLLTRDLWRLTALASSGEWFPPFTEWTLSPRAISFLLDVVFLHKPRTIVELGSGLSTCFLAKFGATVPTEYSVWSIEESEFHANRISSYLQNIQSNVPVRIWVAQVGPDGWYDRNVVKNLPDLIDLLIIDGPANPDQRNRRKPALIGLRDKLREGALIFVHDTHREDERRMVEEWVNSQEVVVVQDLGEFMLLRYLSKANMDPQ